MKFELSSKKQNYIWLNSDYGALCLLQGTQRAHILNTMLSFGADAAPLENFRPWKWNNEAKIESFPGFPD